MTHIEEIKDYWNLRANGFSSAISEELETESATEWSACFKEHIGPAPKKVLDDGTGPGFFPVILAGLGYQVTAIDYSDLMLDQARKRMQAHGLSAEFLQMDAHKLAFSDESFDAIVSRQVIWNLDHPEIALSEMERVLKPGGIVIIDDGNCYLHYHDEDYKKQHDAFRQKMKTLEINDGGLHGKHNTDQVDFSIIDRIAEDLPMSFKRRPQWDFEQLIALGFSDIRVVLRGGKLPYGFRIIARKGSF